MKNIFSQRVWNTYVAHCTEMVIGTTLEWTIRLKRVNHSITKGCWSALNCEPGRQKHEIKYPLPTQSKELDNG
jgi:hypothetical protein